MMWLSWLLVAVPAQAGAPVLVSSFEAQDAVAAPLAQRLPQILLAELEPYEDFDLVDIGRVQPIGGVPAALYLEACPPGQGEGCSLVVAEAAGAAYALTGTVRSTDPLAEVEAAGGGTGAEPAGEEPELELLVELKVLDVDSYEAGLEVVLSYASSTEDSFADAVPMMLQDMLQGYVGQSVDIRLAVPAGPEDPLDRAQAARELDDLSAELGEVAGDKGDDTLTSAPRRDDREKTSARQLAVREQGGPTPWDELGISLPQYAAWWNSGWDYSTWSQRISGRKGQVLLRLQGGVGYGPSHAIYYGRISYYGTELLLEEIYVTHELDSGIGGSLGLSAGYGLLPWLELEAGAGFDSGRYVVDVRAIYPGDSTPFPRDVSERGIVLPQLWGGLRLVPMPYRVLRPVAGLGFAWTFGYALPEDELAMTELPEFTSPGISSLRALLGAELRVADKLDLLLQAPVHLLLAGTDPAVFTETYLDGTEGLGEPREPGKPLPLGLAVQLGAQLRFGGGGAQRAASAGPALEDELLDLEG